MSPACEFGRVPCVQRAEKRFQLMCAVTTRAPAVESGAGAWQQQHDAAPALDQFFYRMRSERRLLERLHTFPVSKRPGVCSLMFRLFCLLVVRSFFQHTHSVVACPLTHMS